MARAITILLLLTIFAFQNLLCQIKLHGDSWQQCKEYGKGTIIVYWHVVEPTTYLIDGEKEGIEVDLMKSFQQYIKITYDVDITIKWVRIDDFNQLLANLSSKSAVGEFGVGNISITEERKNLIRFTPPFLPDMNLLVSSADIPIVSKESDFSSNFLGAKGITIEQTTLASDLEFLKNNHLNDVEFQHVSISDDLAKIIADGPRKFGYIDISVYLHSLKKGIPITRHNIFTVIREGYGIGYSKTDDWAEPIEAFFKHDGFRVSRDNTIRKFLGDEFFELIIGALYSTHFQTAKELELIRQEKIIQSENLKYAQDKLQRETLIRQFVVVILALVLVAVILLLRMYFSKLKSNKILSLKTKIIKKQKSELLESLEGLQLLAKIGQDIIGSLSNSRIEEILFNHVTEMMDTDEFGIGLYNEETGETIYRDYYLDGKKVPLLVTSGNKDTRLGNHSMYYKKDIFMIDVPREYSKYINTLDEYEENDLLNSNITIPIIKDNKAIGVLFTQSKRKNAYNERDFNFMQNLAVYANLALSTAKSFEEIEAKNKQIKEFNNELSTNHEEILVQKENLEQIIKSVEKSSEDLNLLNTIGKEIMSSLSVTKIAELTYRKLNDLMPAEGFGIGFYNPDNKTIEFSGFMEKGSLLPAYNNALDDDRFAVWCFKNEKEIIINDLQKEYSNFVKILQAPLEGDLPDSVIYLPLITQNEVVGVVTVQSFVKNAFSSNNINMLRNLANYIAAAMQNAYTYGKIDSQKEKINSINEQLIALNEEKNLALGIVAHDLRSPLNQIEGLTNLLEVDTKTSSVNNEIIEKITTSTQRLKKMIGSILDVSAIESGNFNLKIEKIDVHDLIKSVQEEMKLYAQKKKIEVTLIPNKEKIYGNADRGFLIQIMENLLSNAIKYSPKNREIKIEVSNTENVVIAMHDQGPGISEEDQNKLFGKYNILSAKPTGGETSTGLGLSIVKKYIDVMGGKVWCVSKLGKGSSFYVELNES